MNDANAANDKTMTNADPVALVFALAYGHTEAQILHSSIEWQCAYLTHDAARTIFWMNHLRALLARQQQMSTDRRRIIELRQSRTSVAGEQATSDEASILLRSAVNVDELSEGKNRLDDALNALRSGAEETEKALQASRRISTALLGEEGVEAYRAARKAGGCREEPITAAGDVETAACAEERYAIFESARARYQEMFTAYRRKFLADVTELAAG